MVADSVLGELQADEDCLHCSLPGGHGTLTILLEGAEISEVLSDALPLAREVFQSIGQLLPKLQAALIRDLLPFKNDHYLEEGESPLTADEFLKRLGEPHAQVGVDGYLSFAFDDADMFWGHGIEVYKVGGEWQASISG